MEKALTTNPRVPVNPASSDSTRSAVVHEANPATTAPPAGSRNAVKRAAFWTRWLNHIALSLFVLFCTLLGVWLALLPWSLQWTDNPLLWTHPELRTFLGYGFVRGVCSGLGILDLWIGIREVAHYAERLGSHK
jgi:hypothetical protein